MQTLAETDETFGKSPGLGALARQIESLSLNLKQICSIEASRNETSQTLSVKALRIFKARRTADKVAELDGFSASPAFDCLLDLYIQTQAGQRVSVTSACVGAACAQSTALRWMHVLEARNFIARSPDPRDGRRTYLVLTDDGRAVIEAVIQSY